MVGVSSFCSYPDKACRKREVGTALTPDIEAIVSLRPDYVLSQQMENSVFEKKVRKLGLKVKNYKFDSLSDILNSIKELGELLKSKHSKQVLSDFNHQLQELRKIKKKGRFLVVIDLYEKMGRVTGVLVAGKGTFYSDLLELTGLKNDDHSGRGGQYHKLELEDLLDRENLSYFFFSPKKNKNEELLKRELSKFSKRKNSFYSFSGDYVVIPGPRLSKLIDELAESLK